MRTIQVWLPPQVRKWRPAGARRLGEALHPEAVTDAWYRLDCPDDFDPRPMVSRREYRRWLLACWLRGCEGHSLWRAVRPHMPLQFRITHFKLPRVRRSFGFYVRGNWWHELELPGGKVLHVRRWRVPAPGNHRSVFIERDPFWRMSLSWPRRKKED